MIRYFFRRPNFPIICDVQGSLIFGKTPDQFLEQVIAKNIPHDQVFQLVDATGESWSFHTDLIAISPLTAKVRWTKKKLIDLVNNSITAQQAGIEYTAKSLSNKRFDQVIMELVSLVEGAEKRQQ
jgi:hypothetical protein